MTSYQGHLGGDSLPFQEAGFNYLQSHPALVFCDSVMSGAGGNIAFFSCSFGTSILDV